ncbi:E3 ubiquitin-protein ligase RHA2A-like [Punica granatum]|uniref:RING-type domain-containing protein n=2 Tax=Punica granatum TaxID=22663 RepID=A0A218XPT5_PUNGR|nr:E3 ubiquitin-protein ligase RHA2A-like [Punica granatum]OWM86282.1 hypothetical protein CDL15_Pgr011106 [Punica granatum]PKI59811.1 hypothetical protein CRG98_019817 [Punica granatum]
MGLQSQLNDVASDSIPLLLLSLIAACFGHLRSSLSALLHSLGLPRSSQPIRLDDPLLASRGSCLAGLVALTDQLNLNRALSHRFSSSSSSAAAAATSSSSPSDQHLCIVCLSSLRDGDYVRRLPCRHVFHKACFDGWLDCRNYSCPLCRAPLAPPERVDCTAPRVGAALVSWFSPR